LGVAVILDISNGAEVADKMGAEVKAASAAEKADVREHLKVSISAYWIGRRGRLDRPVCSRTDEMVEPIPPSPRD
jgi:hypothetical protein